MLDWFNTDKTRLIFADIIAKIWNDSQYKAMLIAEPKRVLQEAGIDNIPENVEILVVENTSKRQYLALSPESSVDELKELMAFIQDSLPLQPGQEIVLVQNTESLQYIVLPFLTNEITLEEIQLIQGGAPKIPSVVNSQVAVNKQVVVAVNSVVVAKTKTLIRG